MITHFLGVTQLNFLRLIELIKVNIEYPNLIECYLSVGDRNKAYKL